MADQRITDDEAAILRSWLSGNGIHAIAKARRTTDAYIAACIDGLCNYDRAAGRDILESGLRPDAAPPAAAPKRVPPSADLPVEPVPAAEPAAAAEPAPPVDDLPLALAPEPEVTVRRRATTPARYLVDDLLVRADRSVSNASPPSPPESAPPPRSWPRCWTAPTPKPQPGRWLPCGGGNWKRPRRSCGR